MTTGGWIVMSLSVGSVTLLFAWCVFKVLTTPKETEKLHSLKEETADVEK